MPFVSGSTKLAEISCQRQDQALMLMNRKVDCLSISYKIQNRIRISDFRLSIYDLQFLPAGRQGHRYRNRHTVKERI